MYQAYLKALTPEGPNTLVLAWDPEDYEPCKPEHTFAVHAVPLEGDEARERVVFILGTIDVPMLVETYRVCRGNDIEVLDIIIQGLMELDTLRSGGKIRYKWGNYNIITMHGGKKTFNQWARENLTKLADSAGPPTV